MPPRRRGHVNVAKEEVPKEQQPRYWEELLHSRDMLPPAGADMGNWLERAGLKKAWQSEYTLHLEERNRALETELLVALSSSAAKDAEIVKLKSKVSLPDRTSSLDLHSRSHTRDTRDPRASQPTLFCRRSQSCKGSCM